MALPLPKQLCSSSLFPQPPEGEEGAEDEKLEPEEDENIKIPMDQYYPDDYDQYDEGMHDRELKSAP